jgi:hypothetical protein
VSLKANLAVITTFASERLGDAATARRIPSFVNDNCRVEKVHFGGDAPWAQGLYDAWENALGWRKEEATTLSAVMSGIGMTLFQVVANYTNTDVMASTHFNIEVEGFRAGELYGGTMSMVPVSPDSARGTLDG